MDAEVMRRIDERLSKMSPITLEEMSGIKLMNRIDTKYLVNVKMLPLLLDKALNDYFVQEIDGRRKASYKTLYFDTADAKMYTIHHDGKMTRQKIRVREYVESKLTFLEIKNKNNKKRTKKVRVSVENELIHSLPNARTFMDEKSNYPIDTVKGRLRNNFSRITLVNKAKTERLTIDVNIRFHNEVSGKDDTIDNLCIVEVKRDGAVFSPFTSYMSDFRIASKSISKYCLGMILTDDTVRKNRFKEKLRYIDKLVNGELTDLSVEKVYYATAKVG